MRYPYTFMFQVCMELRRIIVVVELLRDCVELDQQVLAVMLNEQGKRVWWPTRTPPQPYLQGGRPMLKCIICGKEVERCYSCDGTPEDWLNAIKDGERITWTAETCPEPVCSEACEVAHINATVKVVIPEDVSRTTVEQIDDLIKPLSTPKEPTEEKEFDVEEYRRFCAELFDVLKDQESDA